MNLSVLLTVCFFACSAVCWLHVYRIVVDQQVKGVSVIPTFIFMFTNLVEVVYFIDRLDFWSSVGAVSMFLSNVAWTVCVFHFREKAALAEWRAVDLTLY